MNDPTLPKAIYLPEVTAFAAGGSVIFVNENENENGEMRK